VRLIDSAGLRASVDPIEIEGVRRSHVALADADIILWLGDVDRAPRPDSIRIRSKCDLGNSGVKHDLAVSTVSGVGLDELRETVIRRAEFLCGQVDMILTDRQSGELAAAAAAIERARIAEVDEIVAIEMRAALAAMERFTGRIGVENVLGEIFSRFCVGK
jgi:tRNA modification GTPase